MEPNHSLISGLRLDTASAEDPVEQRIKKAATESDWDVIYVNISSCCSSPSCLAWFDLLLILRFLFTITYSSLIASCSTNRVHCVSSCCWQPKKALSLTLILSLFCCSIFTSCLLYTSQPFKVPAKLSAASSAAAVWLLLFCLFSSPIFYLPMFSWEEIKGAIYHKQYFLLCDKFTLNWVAFTCGVWA